MLPDDLANVFMLRDFFPVLCNSAGTKTHDGEKWYSPILLKTINFKETLHRDCKSFMNHRADLQGHRVVRAIKALA